MPEREELTEQELEANDASQLPDRQVMSLIGSDPTTLTADAAIPDGWNSDGGATSATEAGDTSTSETSDATYLATADGSVTEGDASPTAEDQHIIGRSADSASATS